jgi:succinate-acetate transporter protein
MAALIERWTPAGPIKSALELEQLEQEEARAAATVGSAMPLGLVCLAIALFTWSTVNANWWPSSAVIAAIPLLLICGGLVQFIAAMWSYRKGDTFGATWFGSLGGFFLSWSFYQLFNQLGILHGATDAAMVNGIMFGCFAYVALFLAVAALREDVASFLVLILLAASLGLLTAGSFLVGMPLLGYIGGWCGIASAVVAFYAATALVINSVNMRYVLPLGSPSAHESNGHRPHFVRQATAS